MSASPIAVPSLMFQNHSIPVLVLEYGWFDHGYGPGPLGVDYACLADLGHVWEPRVIPARWLFTLEESLAYYDKLATQAETAAREATAQAARLWRDARMVQWYAENGRWGA